MAGSKVSCSLLLALGRGGEQWQAHSEQASADLDKLLPSIAAICVAMLIDI
jgi:hypothetical protein